MKTNNTIASWIAHRVATRPSIAGGYTPDGAIRPATSSSKEKVMNNFVYASGALKKYLDARSRGAPEEELKKLQAADEADRANKPKARSRARAEWR